MNTHPKLGDFVKTTNSGMRGRVYRINHSCTQGEEWLMQQALLSEEERNYDGPWLDILTNGGGSIHVPACVAEKVEPFTFSNPWESYYFST